MDIDTLLSIRAFKFDSLECLYKLHHRFSRYIEVLNDFANDSASDDELNRRQHEVSRLLKDEEHRFYEWQNGARMRNQDVFGLVEFPVEYLESGALSEAASRATVAFERVIEQAKHELKDVDAHIASVRREQRTH